MLHVSGVLANVHRGNKQEYILFTFWLLKFQDEVYDDDSLYNICGICGVSICLTDFCNLKNFDIFCR